MIDTHCHLTYDPLYERVDEVLKRAAGAGVDRMITVGTSPDDSRRAAVLAGRCANVYATAGVHPHHAAAWVDRGAFDATLRESASDPRVVALGEMGLDTHYDDPPIEDQHRVLRWQLEIAAELNDGSPIIIHNREATDDILAALRGSGIPGGRFVFHCFTGSEAELDAVLEFGAMVSFTGIVTFKNAATLAASARRVPEECLMIETDAPYLTPEPHRKVRPNEPCYVPHVARFLAERRGVDEVRFIETMDENAVKFFRLPG